jgi:predicted enzyme related to lactoylglutathione lyase
MARTQYTVYVAAPDLARLVQFTAGAFEWTVKLLPRGDLVELSFSDTVVAVGSVPAANAIPGILVAFHAPDAEQLAAAAERLGGTTVHRQTSEDAAFIMMRGRTGELFAIQRAAPSANRASPTPGAWLELWTPSPTIAEAFYGELFGWTVERRGNVGLYCSNGAPIASIGVLDEAFDDLAFRRAVGLATDSERRTGPHWMAFCPTRSLEESLGRARFLGGHVAIPPTSLTVGGACALILEPQGGHIGLRER